MRTWYGVSGQSAKSGLSQVRGRGRPGEHLAGRGVVVSAEQVLDADGRRGAACSATPGQPDREGTQSVFRRHDGHVHSVDGSGRGIRPADKNGACGARPVSAKCGIRDPGRGGPCRSRTSAADDDRPPTLTRSPTLAGRFRQLAGGAAHHQRGLADAAVDQLLGAQRFNHLDFAGTPCVLSSMLGTHAHDDLAAADLGRLQRRDLQRLAVGGLYRAVAGHVHFHQVHRRRADEARHEGGGGFSNTSIVCRSVPARPGT